MTRFGTGSLLGGVGVVLYGVGLVLPAFEFDGFVGRSQPIAATLWSVSLVGFFFLFVLLFGAAMVLARAQLGAVVAGWTMVVTTLLLVLLGLDARSWGVGIGLWATLFGGLLVVASGLFVDSPGSPDSWRDLQGPGAGSVTGEESP